MKNMCRRYKQNEIFFREKDWKSPHKAEKGIDVSVIEFRFKTCVLPLGLYERFMKHFEMWWFGLFALVVCVITGGILADKKSRKQFARV